MSSYLQSQIKDRMEAKNLTIYALETKAGTTKNAARNILKGYSKKPSAAVLGAIATVLGCTVNDLTGSTTIALNPTKQTIQDHPWNGQLYVDAVQLIEELINDKNYNFSFEQITGLAAEVYRYSCNKKSDQVDKDFATWLVGRNI